MITPTINSTQFTAKVSTADLTALIAAITTAAIVTLPEGKTLADVRSLNLNVFPTAMPDGTAATINAVLK